MKYYERAIIIKDYQRRNRKAVYVPCTEFVKTNEIEKFNKGKRIKFEESKEAKKYLIHKKQNYVYQEITQLTSSEVYFRKSISRR